MSNSLVLLLLVVLICDYSPRVQAKFAEGYKYIGSTDMNNHIIETGEKNRQSGRGGEPGQIDFYLSEATAGWDDAFKFCKDEQDGHLVSIQSKEKESVLTKFLEGNTLTSVWTSGLYDPDGKFWYFLPGRTLDASWYTNFKQGVSPKTGPAYRIAFYKNNNNPYWLSLPKSNRIRYVCELGDVVEPCFEKRIVVAVLDGSPDTITDFNFGAIKRTTIDYIARALTLQTTTNFGLIVYSNTANIVIDANKQLGLDALVAEIQKAQKPTQRGKNTALAITTAHNHINSVGAYSPKDRVIVLFTDGKSDNAGEAAKAIASVKQDLTTVLFVGIGVVDKNGLLAMASQDSSKVFIPEYSTGTTYSNQIDAQLGSAICRSGSSTRSGSGNIGMPKSRRKCNRRKQN